MTLYNTSANPPAPVLTIKISNPYNPKVEAIEDKALIDSGAFMSAIPKEWVNQLELLPVGDQETSGYKNEGEKQKHETYFVEVSFYNLGFRIKVMAVNRKGMLFPMLIGRDVLNKLKLTLDGKNQSFEVSDPDSAC